MMGLPLEVRPTEANPRGPYAEKRHSRNQDGAYHGPLFTLNARDRIVLENLLPAQGDWIEAVIAEDISTRIRIGREEREEFMKTGAVIVWPNGGVDFEPGLLPQTMRPFSFDSKEVDLISKCLRDKVQEKKFPRGAVRLYRLFIEGVGTDDKPTPVS